MLADPGRIPILEDVSSMSQVHLAAVPLWIWIGAGIAAIPIGLVVLAILWEARSRRPVLQFRQDGTLFELWHSRTLPRPTDVAVVPVSTDLKLVAGSALWVRGVTADMAQREADHAAPRPVGDAVLVAGARYRFKRAALAVVMNPSKLYAAEWIRDALMRSVALAAELPASSVTIPDWTPDLMRQPRGVSEQVRRAETTRIADSLTSSALALSGRVPVVRLWVRDPLAAEIYRSHLLRARETHQAVAA